MDTNAVAAAGVGVATTVGVTGAAAVGMAVAVAGGGAVGVDAAVGDGVGMAVGVIVRGGTVGAAVIVWSGAVAVGVIGRRGIVVSVAAGGAAAVAGVGVKVGWKRADAPWGGRATSPPPGPQPERRAASRANERTRRVSRFIRYDDGLAELSSLARA